MERNELRINNSIDVGALCCPYGVGEVAEILADCVLVRINGSYHQYLFDDIQGIPLTDQILFNFGFKYRNSGIGGQDGWAGYGTWELGGIYFQGLRRTGIVYFSRMWGTETAYVHKLQNLYFALTGTELTTK